jgi:hypothetical protein
MNQKLKKLAEQAGIWRQHYDVGEESPERIFKFAELIVDECIEVVLASNPSPKMIVHEPYRTIMNNIVEHFGVEK